MAVILNHHRRETIDLDEDMTVNDLVDILNRVRFKDQNTCVIRLDKGVRDYIVDALKRHHHAHAWPRHQHSI